MAGSEESTFTSEILDRWLDSLVSAWHHGALSRHRGSELFTGPSSSEKSRVCFSGEVVNHRQAEEQQVWGHLGVCFGEEESYESKARRRRKWWKIRNPDIIARRKGKRINGKAKVKVHQRTYSRGRRCSYFWVYLVKSTKRSEVIQTLARIFPPHSVICLFLYNYKNIYSFFLNVQIT